MGRVFRSIWKMCPDGTDDAQASPMPVFNLSYAVTANALYGVVAGIRCGDISPFSPQDLPTARFVNCSSLDFQAAEQLSLSVSPDERYVLLAKPDEKGVPI